MKLASVATLEGGVTEHHRFLLRQLLDDLKHTESEIAAVEAEIGRRNRPFEAEVTRLCTISGVGRVTASAVLAEIGLNMDHFPTTGHMASWVGLSLGNYESAGKRLSGKTRKGSPTLKRCLVSSRMGGYSAEEQLSGVILCAAGGPSGK